MKYVKMINKNEFLKITKVTHWKARKKKKLKTEKTNEK